jgi:hypothetical protein
MCVVEYNLFVLVVYVLSEAEGFFWKLKRVGLDSSENKKKQ